MVDIMINTQILAISAIFGIGFYIGFKLKGAIIDFKKYLMERKSN